MWLPAPNGINRSSKYNKVVGYIINIQKSAALHINTICYHSVAKWCLTLCDPMDCSTPGFLVLHHVLEFAQTPVH